MFVAGVCHGCLACLHMRARISEHQQHKPLSTTRKISNPRKCIELKLLALFISSETLRRRIGLDKSCVDVCSLPLYMPSIWYIAEVDVRVASANALKCSL